MITPTKAYKTSDGSTFATIEQAQRYDLRTLLSNQPEAMASDVALAEFLVTNSEKVLDILTTGPRSRPTRRKVNGAAPMKRAKRATPERAKELFQELREAVV